MKVFTSISEWRTFRETLNSSMRGTVGFVPTMGALHQGHLSLIEKSKKQNNFTALSIFVNPTQFDQKSDLESYPQNWEQDIEKAKKAGADFVLAPKYDEIYSDSYRYKIIENELSQKLCGAHRDGHFDGVLTIVMKFLNIVKPQKAYFGEKDYQQYLLIKEMCESFFMDVDIVSCPTIRESDGLAMSSRNQRLNDSARSQAANFNKVLLEKETSVEKVAEKLFQMGFEVDYVEDYKDRRLAAVSIGSDKEKVRLIDNVPLS